MLQTDIFKEIFSDTIEYLVERVQSNYALQVYQPLFPLSPLLPPLHVLEITLHCTVQVYLYNCCQCTCVRVLVCTCTYSTLHLCEFDIIIVYIVDSYLLIILIFHV